MLLVATSCGCTEGAVVLLAHDAAVATDALPADAAVATDAAATDALPADALAPDAAPPPDPLEALADVCRAWIDVEVTRYVECYGGDPAYYRSLTEQATWHFCFDENRGGLASGATRLPPENVARCLEVIGTLECGRLFGFGIVQREVFNRACLFGLVEGTRDLGETCDGDQCRPPFLCAWLTDLPGDCSFRCVAWPEARLPLGAPCTELWQCEADLICYSGSCRRWPVVGEPCDPIPCRREAFCDPATHVCSAPHREGDPCDGDRDLFEVVCELGLQCLGPRGATTCQRYHRLGEVCAPGTTECGYWADCTGGRCERNATVGESCAGTRCHPGAYCEPSTQRCVLRAALGAPCVAMGQCLDGDCVAGRCAERSAGCANCCPR